MVQLKRCVERLYKNSRLTRTPPCIIPIPKNPSEEELRRAEFYKNYMISLGYKNVTVEEVDDVTEFVAQLM